MRIFFVNIDDVLEKKDPTSIQQAEGTSGSTTCISGHLAEKGSETSDSADPSATTKKPAAARVTRAKSRDQRTLKKKVKKN